MSDNVIPIGGAPRRRAQPPSADLLSLLPSWELSLVSGDKSKGTIRSYLDSARALVAFLRSAGMPTDAEGVDAEHIRAFLVAEIERTSAGNAAKHHRNLSVMWAWLVREGERTGDPMDRVDRPKVTKKAKTFFTPDEIRALLKVCEGNDFEARRDTAIIRILIDSGPRVSGIAELRYHPSDDARSDVRLSQRRVRITLKGGDELWIPLGRRATAALDRYLRARARHAHADSLALWLGLKGKGVHGMTKSGIQQMLKRRGREAGVQDVHPHRFRRTWTHEWLKGGGTTDEAKAIAGWRTDAMVHEYAGELAAERAREAHERLSPGDRI